MVRRRRRAASFPCARANRARRRQPGRNRPRAGVGWQARTPAFLPTMSDVLTPFADAAIAADAIRSTRRWLERAVIGLNLCPFAKAVYVKRRIRYAVTAATSAEALLAELRA